MNLEEAQSAIGASVIYHSGGSPENGKIVSTNDSYVFVDFGGKQNIACYPSSIAFPQFRYDYVESRKIFGEFYPLMIAALRKADSFNFEKLRQAFPELVAETLLRYNAPGGLLEGE